MLGIGKEIIAAYIGAILKSHRLKVNNIKLYSYLNIDAGKQRFEIKSLYFYVGVQISS